MAREWDYANLSHAAKMHGGPESYKQYLINIGRNEISMKKSTSVGLGKMDGLGAVIAKVAIENLAPIAIEIVTPYVANKVADKIIQKKMCARYDIGQSE